MKKYAILILGLWILSLAGCATVPQKEAMPTYNINGVSYIPLVSLCESRGIKWEYDTFSRTVALTKDTHRINLMVGDTLVLVDGNPVHLKSPVHFYQGAVVVPYKFKEQVLDVLFKREPTYKRAAASLGKIKKIVIDAGHGGNDPGAIGRTGLREKDVNLDIAKRLAQLLKSDGASVVLTRSIDRFIPLSQRVEIANRSKADLFISIHSNASRVRRLNGFEVYYISWKVDDSKRALTAARNSIPDFLSTNSFYNSSLNLKTIVWDMIYADNRAEAIELSRAICRSVDCNLDAEVLGVKNANFEVLRGTQMPAVLIETGFVSNYEEERMLKNSYYRQKIAESISEAIHNYAGGLVLVEAD